MQNAAHPVTTEVPPIRYDGTTCWFKYSDAVEGWCDLTKVEAKRSDPAIAARLSGRAELFKERLDRDRLKDPETGAEYFSSTLRSYFVKDGQSVFLSRFFQMLHCNSGQPDATDAIRGCHRDSVRAARRARVNLSHIQRPCCPHGPCYGGPK